MIAVLRKKAVNLVRGEDGVALVVTLALFMLMYVSCAGVFAVGQAVKEKVVLQNAVDAAAYSAAVVQADTLSRIATINRAMAWTYKSLVCYQMDYVTRRWLDESLRKYDSDSVGADYIGGDATGVPFTIRLHPIGECPPESLVDASRSMAPAADVLEGRILPLVTRLSDMNDAIADLVDGLHGSMEKAALDAIRANLPSRNGSSGTAALIGDKCLCHLNAPDGWDVLGLKKDWSNPDAIAAEKRFLGFEGLSSDRFQDWYGIYDSDSGISRFYDGGLVSEWWVRKGASLEHRVYDAGDFLSDDAADCWNKGALQVAKPVVLDREYFPGEGGEVAKGAVTVAVAKKLENPWARLVDMTVTGFYDVFRPSRATEWVYAVGSAQAAWRKFVANTEDGLAYSLDYDEVENLRTDDWDAVFVPVRKSISSEDFKNMMTKSDGWEFVSDSPSPDISSGYVLLDGNVALPRMHNSGSETGTLAWDRILSMMYH